MGTLQEVAILLMLRSWLNGRCRVSLSSKHSAIVVTAAVSADPLTPTPDPHTASTARVYEEVWRSTPCFVLTTKTKTSVLHFTFYMLIFHRFYILDRYIYRDISSLNSDIFIYVCISMDRRLYTTSTLFLHILIIVVHFLLSKPTMTIIMPHVLLRPTPQDCPYFT